jgi:signal transduction histidine kinase
MNLYSRIAAYFLMILLIASTFIGCSSRDLANEVNLAGEWKLIKDDNLNFKNPDYDDSKWPTVVVPKRLEQQGYKDLNGTWWYRKNVVIPSQLSGKLLALYFSNLADSDQVFFNSVLIGESGSFEPNGSVTPHFSRVYKIPSNIIKFDAANNVSIRFSKRYGPFIGLFNQNPTIGSFASLQRNAFIENFFKSHLIFFGAFLVLLLAFYHFIIYSKLKIKSDYLLFSLACLSLACYEISLSFWPYAYFNNLSLVTKINLISANISVAFLVWFTMRYFNLSTSFFLRSAILIASIFVIATLFINDPNINLKLFSLEFIFCLIGLLYIFYLSVKYVILKKIKGNFFLPLGIAMVLLSACNDIFITTGLYYFYFLTAYGFLFYFFGIAISLANDFTNAYKAEELKAKTLDNINKASLGISSELNLEKLIYNSIDILKRHLGVERCSILLLGDGGRRFSSHNRDENRRSPDTHLNSQNNNNNGDGDASAPSQNLNNNNTIHFGDELKEPLSEISWILEDGQQKPYIMKDIEDTFSGTKSDSKKNKLRELMVVPMIHHKKTVGIIAISKKTDGTIFTEDDKEFVSIIAPQLALAVENAAAYREIEDQVKKQRDMLIMSEKMAAIGQLTSGIGHEINNPVNFIISYVPPVRENVETMVEILKLYEQLQSGDGGVQKDEILKKIAEIKKNEKFENKLPRILRSLDAISDGANRVASIVDSLKAYARTDTLPDEIDLNVAIDKSLVILNNKLKNKVEVKKEYGENVKAKCYSSINQVIVNLISNAADAIPEKGEILIRTQALKDKVRISVKDNGSGMTDEVKKKLFTPFFTTKGPGKGTGLGLSITYNIVYDQHHGSIEIQSEPGKGSTFTVTVPKEIITS